jgi:hypothetical protein
VKPRSDVSAAGLNGALATLIMIALDHSSIINFDFATVEAAIVTLAVFAGGYIAPRFKPLYGAITGAIAVLLTSVIGYLLFGVDIDNGLLSTSIAAAATAFMMYRTPPYAASELDPEYAVSDVRESGATERRRRIR